MSIEHQSNEEPRRGRGIWSAIAYFAGVAALVLGIYWIAPPDSPETTEEVPEATPTTVAAVDVQAPSNQPGEEPIADAAEIILPSVVHIETSSGLGSGVIYDSDGLIVTAAHVVGDDQTVGIRFADGEQVSGTVLGAVTDVDIAVIEVDKEGLRAATFSLEKPRVGQLAIAVGSPWGLESTVTAGIISAVDQANCAFDVCTSMVQTDAAINPGNSGGALVDRAGRVVGINVSIFTQTNANSGVGFAVPSDTVMEYAESIVTGVPIETAFLGVRGENFDAEGQAGAEITVVVPETAAAESGIQVGDVIVSIDGFPIRGIGDLAAQVRTYQPGETVELVLLREGREVTLEVTLGAQSEDLS